MRGLSMTWWKRPTSYRVNDGSKVRHVLFLEAGKWPVGGQGQAFTAHWDPADEVRAAAQGGSDAWFVRSVPGISTWRPCSSAPSAFTWTCDLCGSPFVPWMFR